MSFVPNLNSSMHTTNHGPPALQPIISKLSPQPPQLAYADTGATDHFFTKTTLLVDKQPAQATSSHISLIRSYPLGSFVTPAVLQSSTPHPFESTRILSPSFRVLVHKMDSGPSPFRPIVHPFPRIMQISLYNPSGNQVPSPKLVSPHQGHTPPSHPQQPLRPC